MKKNEEKFACSLTRQKFIFVSIHYGLTQSVRSFVLQAVI